MKIPTLNEMCDQAVATCLPPDVDQTLLFFFRRTFLSGAVAMLGTVGVVLASGQLSAAFLAWRTEAEAFAAEIEREIKAAQTKAGG